MTGPGCGQPGHVPGGREGEGTTRWCETCRRLDAEQRLAEAQAALRVSTRDVEQAAAKIEKLLGDCESLGTRLSAAQALCREAADWIEKRHEMPGYSELLLRLRAMGGE